MAKEEYHEMGDDALFTKKFTRRAFLQTAVAGALALGWGGSSFAKVFLAEKGFELGVKTRLDVQDAELNLMSARASLAGAQRDYRVARVNLEWVSGAATAAPAAGAAGSPTCTSARAIRPAGS